jgi:succinate dehydrogenase/fumarate reductase cytochrome b subunit
MLNLPFNGIFGLLVLVADVWAIISIFQSGASGEKKALWIVLVVLLPVLGLILWYILGPRSGVANRGL